MMKPSARHLTYTYEISIVFCYIVNNSVLKRWIVLVLKQKQEKKLKQRLSLNPASKFTNGKNQVGL